MSRKTMIWRLLRQRPKKNKRVSIKYKLFAAAIGLDKFAFSLYAELKGVV